MFDYLGGAGVGPDSMATMPGASVAAPTANFNPEVAALAAAAPPAALPMPMPAGPPQMGSPLAGPAPPMIPAPPMPHEMQYVNETQQDGTVLMRIKNPDGSMGPVVSIVKPPTSKAK